MKSGDLPAEAKARVKIDADLKQAGWIVQDRSEMNLTAGADLEEFVQSYCAGNRQGRVESERFKKFTYEELIARDKTNLDILWLKDDSIVNAADLPAPEVIAEEILESLQSAVGEIQAVLDALNDGKS